MLRRLESLLVQPLVVELAVEAHYAAVLHEPAPLNQDVLDEWRDTHSRDVSCS